jgi:ribosome-associated translation inhibitor RaiA
MEESQQLGGNIELVGFRELDGGSMIILKKIIGSYARKFSDRLNGIDKLTIRMKNVGNSQFELNCLLQKEGQQFNSEVIEYNLFVGIDKILKKIENSVLK